MQNENKIDAQVSSNSELLSVAEKLRPLAERWEKTEVWHNPLFLSGKINITTGDLRNISELLRRLQQYR